MIDTYGPYKIKSFLALFAMASLLLFTGCDQGKMPENDFLLAEKAYQSREMQDAEMYYLRFLRKNQGDEKRWYVWQQLLDIALNFRQDKNAAKSYLEVMRQEFAQDNIRYNTVNLKLADIAMYLQKTTQAIALWEEFLESEDAPAENKAQVARKLSNAYLQRLEFLRASASLELCLDLPVSQETIVDCLYDLGVSKTLTEELPAAEEYLRRLLAMPEAQQEQVVPAVFLLADIYEQQEKYEEAKQLFEQIIDKYPNTHVINLHLTFLQQKLRKK